MPPLPKKKTDACPTAHQPPPTIHQPPPTATATANGTATSPGAVADGQRENPGLPAANFGGPARRAARRAGREPTTTAGATSARGKGTARPGRRTDARASAAAPPRGRRRVASAGGHDDGLAGDGGGGRCSSGCARPARGPYTHRLSLRWHAQIPPSAVATVGAARCLCHTRAAVGLSGRSVELGAGGVPSLGRGRSVRRVPLLSPPPPPPPPPPLLPPLTHHRRHHHDTPRGF